MTGGRLYWRAAKAAAARESFHAKLELAGARLRRERRRRLQRRAAMSGYRASAS